MSTPPHNQFSDFTTPQLYAYTYEHFGEKVLRTLFEIMPKRNRRFLENHNEAIQELRRIDLNKLADILEDYSPRFISRYDLTLCPYDPIKRKMDYKYWLESNERDKKRPHSRGVVLD